MLEEEVKGLSLIVNAGLTVTNGVTVGNVGGMGVQADRTLCYADLLQYVFGVASKDSLRNSSTFIMDNCSTIKSRVRENVDVPIYEVISKGELLLCLTELMEYCTGTIYGSKYEVISHIDVVGDAITVTSPYLHALYAYITDSASAVTNTPFQAVNQVIECLWIGGGE